MDIVMWAPVAGTVVSVAGGVASVFGWVRARGEREESARQAGIATDSAAAAAAALSQIAEVHHQQNKRQQAREVAEDQRRQANVAAEEREPWSIGPISGTEAHLVNGTPRPKYGVTVKISIGDQLFSDETIGFVGPGRPARISYINVNQPVTATITWHLLEDLSDSPPPQAISW